MSAEARSAPQRVAAVVFDLDDTLYPEMDFVLGGLRAAADAASRRYGVDAEIAFLHMEAALQADLAEHGRAMRVFDVALEALGVVPEPEGIARLVDAYRAHEPCLSPYDDVVTLLDTLRGRVVLGVITDGAAAVQRSKYESLGLSDYFGVVVFTDEYGSSAWKPSTFAFELVESQVGHSEGRFVYVGDNPVKDFRGARDAGWHTVRVRREGGLHVSSEPGEGYAADSEIPTLAALEADLASAGLVV